MYFANTTAFSVGSDCNRRFCELFVLIWQWRSQRKVFVFSIGLLLIFASSRSITVQSKPNLPRHLSTRIEIPKHSLNQTFLATPLSVSIRPKVKNIYLTTFLTKFKHAHAHILHHTQKKGSCKYLSKNGLSKPQHF